MKKGKQEEKENEKEGKKSDVKNYEKNERNMETDPPPHYFPRLSLRATLPHRIQTSSLNL